MIATLQLTCFSTHAISGAATACKPLFAGRGSVVGITTLRSLEVAALDAQPNKVQILSVDLFILSKCSAAQASGARSPVNLVNKSEVGFKTMDTLFADNLYASEVSNLYDTR